jgi:lipopolysaccharide/colanic/teichoic acid biosynthesis glycosyltransferase
MGCNQLIAVCKRLPGWVFVVVPVLAMSSAVSCPREAVRLDLRYVENWSFALDFADLCEDHLGNPTTVEAH